MKDLTHVLWSLEPQPQVFKSLGIFVLCCTVHDLWTCGSLISCPLVLLFSKILNILDQFICAQKSLRTPQFSFSCLPKLWSLQYVPYSFRFAVLFSLLSRKKMYYKSRNLLRSSSRPRSVHPALSCWSSYAPGTRASSSSKRHEQYI